MSDKYVSKEYAKIHGFYTTKTYQLVKYPHQINFKTLPKNYVIKPVDLCDSHGVYLVKDNIDLKKNSRIIEKQIVNELHHIRSKIFNEYYMHNEMYNGLIPFNGYIVEELLLDNNEIPSDYKCYVFGGKLYFIAVTYNRRKENNEQLFDSVWVDRNWKPIKTKMIKKNYKYQKLKKPYGFETMIQLVEKMGNKLQRHCRIDVYLINGKVYFGEYTFFCGAILHTFICNMILGIIWLIKKDNYEYNDKQLNNLTPSFYNKI